MPSNKKSKKKSKKGGKKAACNPPPIDRCVFVDEMFQGTCRHGWPDPFLDEDDLCLRLMSDFEDAVIAESKRTDKRCGRGWSVFLKLLANKYPFFNDVVDEARGDFIYAAFLARGAEYVMQENMAMALGMAEAVLLFEASDSFHDCESSTEFASKYDRAFRKLKEVAQCGRPEIIRLFSKRTSCSCLEEKYKEVKAKQHRTGVCDHCEQRKGFNDLMACGKCKTPVYCSKECQKAAWPKHKLLCKTLSTENWVRLADAKESSPSFPKWRIKENEITAQQVESKFLCAL